MRLLIARPDHSPLGAEPPSTDESDDSTQGVLTAACDTRVLDEMRKLAGGAEVGAISVGGERSLARDEMEARLMRVAASAHAAVEMATALAEVVRVLQHCSWLEGSVRLELVSDRDGVKVDLYTEQGSVRERALAPVVLGIPLDELDVALQAVPDLFAPLRMRHHKGKLVFTQRGIAATLPPPEIEVSSDSLLSKVDNNPHEKKTVKQPAYVLPVSLRSGTRLRRTPDDER